VNYLDDLQQKLAGYSMLEVRREPTILSAISLSPGGYEVRLAQQGESWTVSFAGWHERFLDVDEAILCFGFGLSDRCRLRVISYGDVDSRWIVEAQEGDEWVSREETGLLFPPLFLKKRERLLQNNVVSWED
jgi:hypothetical protein